MKNSFLLLSGAAILSLGSCSQDKTATTTTDATATMAATGAGSDAAVEARAQRIADKMVADMKITDEATKAKVRTAYLNRSRRLTGLRSKYTTDTMGSAAATREANAETDTEFKGVFTDPTQYQSYESSRTTYDDSNFPDDAAGTGTTDNSMSAPDAASTPTMSSPAVSPDNAAASPDASASSGPNMATKSKVKMADGSKVKTKEDGTIKLKDADGNKTKIK